MAPEMIRRLAAEGALFVVNHSGGKDSQAMYLHLKAALPEARIVIVHADLAEVEWRGAVDHIMATTGGETVHTCKARRGLLQMIDERGMFPSPTLRQCTSDLKRGPIERTIRGLVKLRKQRGEAGHGLVVNCMGMRADESRSRAKLTPLKLSAKNSVAGRAWYDWLPIHDWTERDVFAAISAAGQQPHPVYSHGMTRFSCCFCVMASQQDLTTAARLSKSRPDLFNDPDLYRKYVQLEVSTRQVMLMPTKRKGQPLIRRTLEEVTGVAA